MFTTNCIICGNNQEIKVLYKENLKKRISGDLFSARRVPDKIHYRIVLCVKCGLVFSNPIFENKKIFSFYKKSKVLYGTEEEYIGNTYIKYFKYLLNNKKLRNIKVLEIGCGSGFFLNKAKELGIKNVYGIEPGKLTVKNAKPEIRKRIIVDFLKPGLFKNGTFDIVCCFHTLDHVFDPREFMLVTNKLLKKGGKAFFIIHDVNGLSVRLLGERSPIFDIEHIFLFNKKTISLLFKKNGLKKINVFQIENMYPLYYWFKLFPLPARLKKAVQSIFIFSKIGFLPISIKAGNIGIIAEK